MSAQDKAAFDWLLAEKERLERCIDAAFRCASAGDAHGARLELTEARWGSVLPERK